MYSYYKYFPFANTLLTANTTLQNNSLSTHIHGCFLVESVIYMTLSEGKYPLKSVENIYCNIMMVDSLMIACLVYVCKMFIQQHLNNKEGNFFFNSDQFIGKDPPTVEQLKRQLENKNTKYISMLRHCARNIRGSDNFWRSKIEDLKHWITDHIARDNDPSMFFIKLSYAENWWPDLMHLLGQLDKYTKNHPRPEAIRNGCKISMANAAWRYPLYVNDFS
jgi:hypothetical protein